MTESYKRPPITEAIIGITFSDPLDPTKLGSVNKKFHKTYPRHQEVKNVSLKVAVNQEGQANADGTQVTIGHRLANIDANELLVLWPAEFVVSQLAPYPGWDAFVDRFRRDWKAWTRAVGFRQIGRIGVRFVNRIDIPVTGDKIDHEKYLNVYAKLPNLISEVHGYAIQMATYVEDIKCTLQLNSGTVKPPILHHGSFLLDIDFGRKEDVPQSDADILALLDEIRAKKNEVFEACVTKRARRLFRQ